MLHLSECFGVYKDFSERTFKISQHRYQVKKTIFFIKNCNGINKSNSYVGMWVIVPVSQSTAYDHLLKKIDVRRDFYKFKLVDIK